MAADMSIFIGWVAWEGKCALVLHSRMFPHAKLEGACMHMKVQWGCAGKIRQWQVMVAGGKDCKKAELIACAWSQVKSRIDILAPGQQTRSKPQPTHIMNG
jgi:hypothetical protein